MCWQHIFQCDICHLRLRWHSDSCIRNDKNATRFILCLLSVSVNSKGKFERCVLQLQMLLQVEIWQQPPIALFSLPTVMIRPQGVYDKLGEYFVTFCISAIDMGSFDQNTAQIYRAQKVFACGLW